MSNKTIFLSAKYYLLIFFALPMLISCAAGGVRTPSGAPITDVIGALENGEIRLSCDTACSGAWGSVSRKVKELHDNGLWRDLAIETARVGFREDLAYYYLGRSAEGLGYDSAADTYYRLALANRYKCDGFINNCDGFVFPQDINKRQNILADKKAEIEASAAAKKSKEDSKIAAEKAKVEEQIAAEKAKDADRIAAEEAEAKLVESKKIAAENAAADEAAKKAAAEGAIDVIGLFPGITTKQQVEFAKANYGFIIGGYELLCVPEFKDNKLYSFTCVTGEDNLSRDRVKGSNEQVSNIEVYEELFKGFSKKFGIPQTSENQVRTKLGVKYVSEIAVWKDKRGNQLSLISIANTTDSGALLLESVEKINADREAEMKANQKRNF